MAQNRLCNKDEQADEERSLADLRGQGLQWAEVAARLGGSPEALRNRHRRALDRVAPS